MSLIIYIIVLLILIGVISMFTRYFYKNSNEIVISNNTGEQYTKFVSYITKDINSNDFTEAELGSSNKVINIYFRNNVQHQYKFENNNIYFFSKENNTIVKKLDLCTDIQDCNFQIDGGYLKTQIKINDITYNDKFKVKILISW